MTDFWAYVLAWIIIICASVFIMWIVSTAALIVASAVVEWRERRARGRL